LIYDQMDEAYRRAFIDEATGAALDNVVALLGVTRNPPLSAKGEVTYFLRGATDTPVVIPADTRVADESGRTFRTTQEGVIPQEKDEFRVQSEGVLRVTDLVAELVGIWPREVEPDPDLTLATGDPPVSEEDERTITLADGVRPEGQLRVRYRPRSVTVPIEAVQPGPDGNVNAETIVIMPTPPRGVDGVVNEEPVTGGVLPEPDDQLRERAKHALEQAGNATLNAIRFGVLDVDGVEGVEIIDHSVDDTVPLGEVRVRYFGGARTEVLQAVEETRAAGVLARLDEIEQVLVSGAFYLIPEPDAPSGAVSQFLSAVVEVVNAFAIGEPLSIRRLNALVYDVPGLADVAEAQLEHDRGGNAGQPVTDPLLIGPTELVRPDATNLGAVLVGALAVAASRRVGTNNELDLQLLDAEGNPIGWRNFSLDVTVTVLARLQTAPDQPPARVGSLTPTVIWNDTGIATLTITPGDVAGLEPGYRPEDHLPTVDVVVGAAAYPGILDAEGATIDLSGT
ncbi:MAG TPA: baseplate J/gp47 family protein, partial [Rubrobacter sp.]